MKFGLFALAVSILSNISLSFLLKQLASRSHNQSLFSFVVSYGGWLNLLLVMFLGFSTLAGYFISLRYLPVIVAYPVATGSSLLGIVLGGFFLFGESLGPMKLFAIAAIALGSFVLVRL